MIRGVIFDIDGLMTDTERLFLTHWCQVMRELGYPEHREIVQHCAGLNYHDSLTYVRRRLGADFDYDGVLKRAAALSEAYCRSHGVPVKPGLYRLLDYLDEAHIPYDVATSTGYPVARRRLEDIGVWDRLKGVVTGDMVSRGKPDPELFLMACRLLSLPPEQCMVLEDSVHGILAAHRAGCMPVMIPDLHGPDEQTAPMLFALVNRLDQVIPILEESNRI